MVRHRRWGRLILTSLGLASFGLAGCQTWEGGMTLPSGRYLEHPPQYILPDPPFPLMKELADQEEKAGLVNGLPRDPGAPPLAVPAIPGVPVGPGVPPPGAGGGGPLRPEGIANPAGP